VIRVVADANVLISAALARNPGAPSVAVLDAVIDGRVVLVMSPTLLGEIRDVPARTRLRRFLTEAEAARFVADLAAPTSLVPDAPPPHPKLCRDPGDDYLLALVAVRGFPAVRDATIENRCIADGKEGVIGSSAMEGLL